MLNVRFSRGLREYTPLDQLLIDIDQGIRTLFIKPKTSRPNPADNIVSVNMSPQERQHTARLIRVDHVGEICAQALYQGQAFTARSDKIRETLYQSAIEENDHLNWCQTRLEELDSHRSYLNPLWYIGALTIGAVAGLMGDKWSLGFVTETERQVVQHLDDHVSKLPSSDEKTRAILLQMREDEAHHASVAIQAGGAELPGFVKMAMQYASKVMTMTAYWV